MGQVTAQKYPIPGAVSVPQLTELAIGGLEKMFDAERQLFCFHITRTPGGFVREGVSHRYTVISLLGLRRLEIAGERSPIPIIPVFDHLLGNSDWVDNLGDLGLLLWLGALACPERIKEINARWGLKRALGGCREGRTMELAWFISGLAHASVVLPRERAELEALAYEAYRLLARNQGKQGAFGHLGGRTMTGLVRGRIGSFADQVYPIYALVQFATAYQFQTALAQAVSCAENIRRLQGPWGEWWWHYDASTGEAFQRYPVFAVHQDGMAPMALRALGEAARLDFRESVSKGLQWIAGSNELGYDMRDASCDVIWRSLEPTDKYRQGLKSALKLLGVGGGIGEGQRVKVNYECRPYHLGWILYAYASRKTEFSALPLTRSNARQGCA
jgi:hypothetical protein